MPDALIAIAQGLADELAADFPELRIIRDGRFQITVFNPMNFKYLQVVISQEGVHIIEDTKRRDYTAREYIGHYPFDDPKLIKYMGEAVSRWLNKQEG